MSRVIQFRRRPFELWVGFLGLLLLFGAYGAVQAAFPGHGTFATTNAIPWGLLIAVYVFFVVTSTGLCLVSSLGHVFGIERYRPLGKRAVALAIITLVAGFGVIGLDLEYPHRMLLGAALRPNPSSAIWWMGSLYSLYLVFLLLEFWGLMRERMRLARIGGALAFVAAISAHSMLGAVFGFVAARPYWYGPFMPIYFILSALVSGAALLALVFFLMSRIRRQEEGHEAQGVTIDMGILLGLFLGIMIFFTTWKILSGLYGQPPLKYEATMALVSGPLSLNFWAIRVFIGLLLPFGLLVIPKTRTTLGVLAAAGLTLIGLFVDRMELVEAGQIVPGSVMAHAAAGFYLHYAPSLVEIAIVVGAFAFTALVYSLAERRLPLREERGAAH